MGALIHRKFRDSNYEKGQGESQRQGKVRLNDGELFDNPQENDCLPRRIAIDSSTFRDVYRFGCAFLCFFLLHKQKKEKTGTILYSLLLYQNS